MLTKSDKPLNDVFVASKRAENNFFIRRFEPQNLQSFVLSQNLLIGSGTTRQLRKKEIPNCNNAWDTARFLILWSAYAIPSSKIKMLSSFHYFNCYIIIATIVSLCGILWLIGLNIRLTSFYPSSVDYHIIVAIFGVLNVIWRILLRFYYSHHYAFVPFLRLSRIILLFKRICSLIFWFIFFIFIRRRLLIALFAFITLDT